MRCGVALCVSLVMTFLLSSNLNAQPDGGPLPKGGTDQEIREKLDSIQRSLNELTKKTEEKSPWYLKDLGTLLISFLAIVVSLYSLYRNYQMNMRTTQQKANDEKAKMLHERLDKFYGPLVQLRNTSRLLYEAFKARQPDPANFRTLTALLSGVIFEGNDKILLEEIIKLGEETEKLILNSSGLVDEDLQEILGKATTHYRVLRLAHNGMLKGEPEKLAGYVFPRELDEVIDKKLKELRKQLDGLRTVA